MKTIYALLLLLSPFVLFAQLETALWHFGIEKGLDFTSGTPVALNDS